MSTGSHDIYTHSDTFGIVVDHYGDARGTKNQFANSDPSTIDPLINENINAYHFATETLTPQLGKIRSALEACWTGDSANNALSILTVLSTDATTIGANTKACHDSFVTFQASWTQLKGQAAHLYEGVAGSGVHEDNNGAHTVFKQFTGAMQTSMHAMPSHLNYTTPLDGAQHAGGPGPGGPGPGGLGGPGGPGGPGGGWEPGGWGPGPGTGGGPGPGHSFPGPMFHPPGTPGSPGSPGSAGSPGGTYQGGNGGYPPGSGLNTGSQLAGYTGGPGPGGPGFGGPGPGFGGPGFGGPGPGFGGPGPGFALTGAGVGAAGAIDAEAGIAGVGSGETTAGGRPMLGGRGGGGSDDEDERDRTTWLSEEEGIWDGETSAPPGTIA